MKAERIVLSPAFVLHQYPWRETSRVVEIWSREHGRLGLVARGVRRSNSPFRSLLQPFSPLLLSWSQRSDLGNLSAAESGGARPALHGRQLMAAFYLNELILRLLPRQDVQGQLYDSYVAALEGLASRRSAPVLRVFEKRLLAALGYGLSLDRAATIDAPVKADQQYVYDLDSGPIPTAAGRVTGLSISGRALLALNSEDLDDEDDLKAVQRLLRAALQKHLGDRPLKTSGVMRALVR